VSLSALRTAALNERMVLWRHMLYEGGKRQWLRVLTAVNAEEDNGVGGQGCSGEGGQEFGADEVWT